MCLDIKKNYLHDNLKIAFSVCHKNFSLHAKVVNKAIRIS